MGLGESQIRPDGLLLREELVVRKNPCGAKQPPVPADNRDAVRQALASI
jgi:hypothetical protein